MIWFFYAIIMAYLIFLIVNLFIKKTLSEEDQKEKTVRVFLLKHATKHTVIRIALLCSFIAIFAFGAVFGVSHIPRNVQQELSGIEFVRTGDNEASKLREVNISIDGRLHNGMFSRPRFNGYINIDVYPDTGDNKIWMSFSPFGGRRFSWGGLHYFDFDHRGMRPFGPSGWLHFSDSQFSSVIFDIRETDASIQAPTVTQLSEDGSAVVKVPIFELDDDAWRPKHIIVAPATDFESAEYVMQRNGVDWNGTVTALR